MRGIALALALAASAQADVGDPFPVKVVELVGGWNGMYLCSLPPGEAQARYRERLQKSLRLRAEALCPDGALPEMCSEAFTESCQGPRPGYMAELSGLFRCRLP